MTKLCDISKYIEEIDYDERLKVILLLMIMMIMIIKKMMISINENNLSPLTF